jgi:tetratricopeptide (TPR) repeat protein
MAVNSRIADLRRRIEKDPASIVFAQLAEEHRRAGDLDDAIRVCRAGLVHHPGYFSARVTLGRALMATGALEEAEAEFEHVLRAAPHNLGAVRALEELRQQREAQDRAQGSGIGDRRPQNLELPNLELPNLERLIPDPGSLIAVSDPVLVELESWLTAIVADRHRRSA